MKIWYPALVLFCCTLALGCRTSQHVAALQRDNRLKEDEIYRLRWQLQDCQEELERYEHGEVSGITRPAAPRPGQTLLERLGAPAAPQSDSPSELSVQVGESISPDEFLKARDVDQPEDGPALFVPQSDTDASTPDASTPDASAADASAADDTEARDDSAGNADMGVAPSWSEPGETRPGDGAQPADEAPRWSPPTGRQPEQPSPDTRFRVPAEPEDGPVLPSPNDGGKQPLLAEQGGQVTQLRIDTEHTGGHNLDGRSGDDGLMLVIHPLDEQGRSLHVPAAVSIVLLDPALKGEAARVARWDFTADEVASAIRATGGAQAGIPLKVVWRNVMPQNEVLHLFVRYTTADGRRLEDQTEIRIRLPGSPASAGWRTAPEQGPPSPPQEDRSTSNPEEPDQHTRFASRDQAASQQAVPPAQPRLRRPTWSPNRP